MSQVIFICCFCKFFWKHDLVMETFKMEVEKKQGYNKSLKNNLSFICKYNYGKNIF